ncbi:TetR/AcrR family transcriptional regulator [Flagellimonas pacifica]|uniref:Transcriptional regulator, TetR family n=1 Tax=Flagellimonas pacifica TaxID=1247520 RepID=A0A285MCU5_9FLAO|nr:TetR/AcrR family transcriptional regulator [Allomuricauda parva]SNY94980.1 transcriptional regulator, TetR family [Allomuricauda parva]
MESTKKRILNVSRQLFNEQGYSNVTIRMIALELKMSSGNLNYHYKKREDILEALYFEMVAEFDERINTLGQKDFTLEIVKNDIQTSMQRMVDYCFFWTDLYNLLRLNKKVKTHFDRAYQNRINGSLFLLNFLTEKGLLRNFEWPLESQFLAERMVSFGNTWLYNTFLYTKKINATYIDKQANNLLSMLYPYLTELGKKEYKKLLPDYFR